MFSPIFIPLQCSLILILCLLLIIISRNYLMDSFNRLPQLIRIPHITYTAYNPAHSKSNQ